MNRASQVPGIDKAKKDNISKWIGLIFKMVHELFWRQRISLGTINNKMHVQGHKTTLKMCSLNYVRSKK